MRPGPFTRTRTLCLLALFGLAGLALQPLAPLERAFEFASVPTRLLPELAAPLRWLGASEVRAAERDLAQGALETRRQAEELFADEQDAALPTRVELTLGRRFIHGEVIGRGAKDLDEVVVRLASLDGVGPGLPVVAGDHYVGRVTRIASERAREVAVDLVTGLDFYVGAQHAGSEPSRPPRQLVVGGLAPRITADHHGLELAVHNPDGKLSAGGEVRVLEPRFPLPETTDARFDADRWAELASGFLLGELEVVPLAGGGELTRVRPGLDYQGGLFHVLVVAPEGAGEREVRLELETFEAGAWRAVSALTTGVLEPARAGRRFALPAGSELAPGAALAFGGHLLGRLVRVGVLEADARLLGDPGARWAVLARLEGERQPRALGELVSLGRDRASGLLRFRWDARVALGGEGPPVAAELFTGSGLAGVPRGLRIGTAELPRGAGRHELVVTPDPATKHITRCLAWVGPSERSTEGAP